MCTCILKVIVLLAGTARIQARHHDRFHVQLVTTVQKVASLYNVQLDPSPTRNTTNKSPTVVTVLQDTTVTQQD